MTPEQLAAEVAKLAEYILTQTRKRGEFLVGDTKLGVVRMSYNRDAKTYGLTVLGDYTAAPVVYSGLTKAEVKGDLCRDVIAVEVEA